MIASRDRPTLSFGEWVYQRFAPEIKHYCKFLLDRIDPLFHDPEGEQRRAVEEFWAFASASCNDDAYVIAEQAHEHGIETVLTFIEMRQVFLATGVSGLFHLFEKQLYRHVNRELKAWQVSPVGRWQDLEKRILSFDRNWENEPCMNLLIAFQDPDLWELRMVANVIKHGSHGPSYRQLLDSRSKIVSKGRLEQTLTFSSNSVLEIPTLIDRDDVERYRDSILRFWRVNGTFVARRSAL